MESALKTRKSMGNSVRAMHRLAKRGRAQNFEGAICRTLPRDNDLIDDQIARFGNVFKFIAEKGEGAGTFREWKWPGQRHVKTKLFEDVRITPAVDMLDLGRAQIRGESARALGLGHGRTKAIEGFDTGRGQAIERGALHLRYKSDESADLAQDKIANQHRRKAGNLASKAQIEVPLADAFGEAERRLERGMEPIGARLAHDLRPRKRFGPGGRRHVGPGVAVIAEHRRAKTIERCIRARHEIARVARGTHRGALS